MSHGQGTYTSVDGYRYVGDWKDEKAHGQGTRVEDGCTYIGEFKDNNANGQGAETCSDGSKSVGEFKDNQLWNGKLIGADDVVYTVSEGEIN